MAIRPHSINSAYNSNYTKRKYSYHSVETWLTHMLTKNVKPQRSR